MMARETKYLRPTRERCGLCGRVSAIGFSVPNEIWYAAIPEKQQVNPLCLNCFLAFADEKMIPWDEEIQFYPVSLRTHLDRFPVDGDYAELRAAYQPAGGAA